MAVAAQNTNNMTIRSILLEEKLTGLNFTNWYRNRRIVLRYEKKMKFVEQPTGPNFTNWYRNLRIVLRSEGKLAHLEKPLIPPPYHVASQAMRNAYNTLYEAQNEMACLMLDSMFPEL
nr:hypothetical protein [Tanacetum cinerariifolium]